MTHYQFEKYNELQQLKNRIFKIKESCENDFIQQTSGDFPTADMQSDMRKRLFLLLDELISEVKKKQEET